MVCNFCFSNSVYNKANIFLGLIEYELNSLLSASYLVDYISVHNRFDLERYLLNITQAKSSTTKITGMHHTLTHFNSKSDKDPYIYFQCEKLTRNEIFLS